MNVPERPSASLILLLAAGAVAAAGCGRHQDRTAAAGDSAVSSAAGSVATPSTAAPPASAPASTDEPAVTPATLSMADLDVYQNAMTARINEVKQAKAREAKATTAVDSLRALNDLSAESADSTVARAAGVTPRHVANVVQTVGDMLVTLQGQGMTAAGIAQMDTTSGDAEARANARKVIAQLRQHSDSDVSAATAGMAPAVAAAFTRRRPAFDSLRTEAMKLAFGGSK